MKPFVYQTVTASSLTSAMSTLLQAIQNIPGQPPTEVQSSPMENGHATALVILSAAFLESITAWAENVRGGRPRPRRRRPHIMERLEVLLTKTEVARLHLEEVFSQRDAIMHGHLWKAWVRADQMTFASPPVLNPGFGDGRFRDVIDLATRKSKALGLNLFPARIWRRDAYLSLATVAEAAHRIGVRCSIHTSTLHFHVRDGGRLRGFTCIQLARRLRGNAAEIGEPQGGEPI